MTVQGERVLQGIQFSSITIYGDIICVIKKSGSLAQTNLSCIILLSYLGCSGRLHCVQFRMYIECLKFKTVSYLVTMDTHFSGI